MADDHAVMRAIAALTYDEIERHGPLGREEVSLLDRSIARDLRQLEAMLGSKAKGQTLLFALATAIDEALLALEESLGVE